MPKTKAVYTTVLMALSIPFLKKGKKRDEFTHCLEEIRSF